MKNRKFAIILFALFFLSLPFLFFTSCNNPSNDTRDEGHWLILVHFAVDNNIDYSYENEYGIISDYLETLEKLEASDTNNVLDIAVLMDAYNDDVNEVGYTSDFQDGYYHLTGGSFSNDILTSFDEINSGSVLASRNFIDWAWENYPSDYQVYSVFNHGGGFDDENEEGTYGVSTLGIAYDDSDDDSLSHSELGQLTAYIQSLTGRNIDLFFPYACLMGGMELAYEIQDSVDYMTFSEESFPADFWSWEALEAIIANPAISGKTLGKAICESAYNYFSKPALGYDFTLATVDLSQTAALAKALDNFADAAIEYIGDDVNLATTFDTAARNGILMYSPYYTDLEYLMQSMAYYIPGMRTYTSKVISKLDNIITSYRYYDSGQTYYGAGCGLSIFHNLWVCKDYSYYDPSLYGSILDFGVDYSWDEYMQVLDNLYVEGEERDDYESDYLSTSNEITVDGETQYHTFHISGDIDVMYVSLSAGTTYTITTSEATEEADTVLYLLASDGSTQLDVDDNIDYENGNFYSQIEYTPTDSADYLIVCSDYYGKGGDYYISVTTGASGTSLDSGSFDSSKTENFKSQSFKTMSRRE